jgi:hypothetical protein
MKHDAYRPPHEYRGVVPYPLQLGCSTEGCLRHYDDIAHHCGLGALWPNVPGAESQFHRLVLFLAVISPHAPSPVQLV